MVNRETKMWRLRISRCVLALAISFCCAHAAQDVQSQPVQNQTAPVAPSSASPNTAPAYEPSSAWPSAQATASSPAIAPAKTIFHVKYISEGAIYLDAGRNEGLEEGMLLHLVHADPSGGTTECREIPGNPADRRCAHVFRRRHFQRRGNHQDARRFGRRRYRLSRQRKCSPARRQGQRGGIRKLSRRRDFFLRRSAR